MRYVESSPEIEFMDAPRPVRDAAESIYDTFDLKTIKKLVKGVPDKKFDRLVDGLTQEEVDNALMIALNWAIEDSTGVFPESRVKEADKLKTTIKESRLANIFESTDHKWIAEVFKKLDDIIAIEVYKKNGGSDHIIFESKDQIL